MLKESDLLKFNYKTFLGKQAVILFACLAFTSLAFTTTGWQDLESKEAGCSFSMPGQAEVENGRTPFGTLMQIYAYTAPNSADSNYSYNLMYLELTPEGLAEAQKMDIKPMIEDYRIMLLGQEMGELIYDKNISLNGYKGHEFIYAVKDFTSFITIKGYLAEKGVIMQMVITPQSRIPNQSRDRFFRSLKISKP